MSYISPRTWFGFRHSKSRYYMNKAYKKKRPNPYRMARQIRALKKDKLERNGKLMM